jgi:hypothetical protein
MDNYYNLRTARVVVKKSPEAKTHVDSLLGRLIAMLGARRPRRIPLAQAASRSGATDVSMAVEDARGFSREAALTASEGACGRVGGARRQSDVPGNNLSQRDKLQTPRRLDHGRSSHHAGL